MSLNGEERCTIVLFKLEKTEEALEDVRINLENRRWIVVANRLYYAAYYSVSALLISYGYTAKTHEGIVRTFSKEFGLTGKVDATLTKHYGRLLNLRITGDYSDNYNLDETDVLPMIELTKKLIETVSSLAKQQVGL